MYDYLIVGSGLFGSVFAHEMNKLGKKCIIIEQRNHIGGNCYTEDRDGINVHIYGPHIFHTSDDKIWNWINQFAKFNSYKHSPRVNFENKIYSFPINLLTLYQLWGVITPTEAKKKLDEVKIEIKNPKNLKDWILSEVGEDIYNIFVKGYTQKQWNITPENLPSSLIKRIPIRMSFEDNYFFDKYQGIPIGGYTNIFNKLLSNIEVKLNTNYFENRSYWNSISKKIVYTGKIDEFFDYKFGKLDYRSLRFEHELHEVSDYQGCAQMNYTSLDVPFTRITEHKHFEFLTVKKTWITKEYPKDYSEDDIPYYPINNDTNNKIYSQYETLANNEDIIFGGRLAKYKYYDMHQVIASSLKAVNDEKNKNIV